MDALTVENFKTIIKPTKSLFFYHHHVLEILNNNGAKVILLMVVAHSLLLPHQCPGTEETQPGTSSPIPDFSIDSNWKIRQSLRWQKGTFPPRPPPSKAQTKRGLGKSELIPKSKFPPSLKPSTWHGPLLLSPPVLPLPLPEPPLMEENDRIDGDGGIVQHGEKQSPDPNKQYSRSSTVWVPQNTLGSSRTPLGQRRPAHHPYSVV